MLRVFRASLPQTFRPSKGSFHEFHGIPAEVINTIGWPGLVDTYRVDFRMPAGTTAGMASIQITAAWIAGTAVGIAAQ